MLLQHLVAIDVHPALQAGGVPVEPELSQPTEDQFVDNEAKATPNKGMLSMKLYFFGNSGLMSVNEQLGSMLIVVF